MMNPSIHDKWLFRIPPIIIIGAVVVLLPIFSLITVQSINRQKENSIRLLQEKGAALIRSFEAGARTGMMGERWQVFKLQRLIMETAQQPDIEYIRVTDGEGIIRSASNPLEIGTRHDAEAAQRPSAAAGQIRWRTASAPGGKSIFEVSRTFAPLRLPPRELDDRQRRHMMRQHMAQLFPDRHQPPEDETLLIFVGLDMSSVEAARRADTRQSVMTGVALLFVGFTGIILIFLVQSYRSAHTSLTRIRAFSDRLVADLPLGLVALDAERKIVSINPAACSVLRIPPGKMLGEPADRVLPPDLFRHVAEPPLRMGALEKEIDCITADGKTIPLTIMHSALTDEAAGGSGTLLLFRDLSDVRALQKEVLKSQRLASVGKLAAGVAHEVRNPLSSIKGFATYFKEKYREVAEDRHIATIMIQEVDRLNRVVSQLLELARPVAVVPKPVPVQPFMDGTLQLVQAQADARQIDIARRIGPEVTHMVADPDRLSQVLLNLYLNAIEAMAPGGTLGVAIAPDGNEGGVRIEVSDTGPGIAAGDLPHVFDPYFTTKPGGTGLGLAVAHNIIEAHHGKIRAQSREGRGTVMTLFLPGGRERLQDHG